MDHKARGRVTATGLGLVSALVTGARAATRALHVSPSDTLSIAGDGNGGVWVASFDRASLEHRSPPG